MGEYLTLAEKCGQCATDTEDRAFVVLAFLSFIGLLFIIGMAVDRIRSAK